VLKIINVYNLFLPPYKENPDLYPNTDWSKLILKNNAPRQSHSVNVVAGTKAIRSKASFNYDKTGGLYNGLSLEQYSIRFSNDIKINKFIDCSLDMHYLYGLSEAPDVPESDIMFYSRISAPIYAAKWSDGRVAGGKNGDNIYAYLNYGGYNKSRSNSFTGKAQVDIRPFEGLKLSAVFSPQVYNSKAKNFITQIPYYSAEDPTIFKGYISRYNATSLKETRNDNYRVTTQFLANYIKTFGSHNINFLGGYEDFYAFNEGLNASRDQYTLTSFPYLNLGPLEYRDNAGSAYENAYRSWFGRLMYNYQNKYFLQGNVRYDGSSRFHSDYRWGVFPSFSVGWMISEENFMKGFDRLSSLKLRASWGTLGNERIGNYPYQSTIEFGNALFTGGSGVVSAQTAAQRQYVIENISWETTESYNIGFDASFFGSKLRLNGDYYKKTTKDMLLALEIPDYIGFDNPDQNTGKMFTNGWEVEAGWNDRMGEIGYSVSFNISDFKSVMGNLGGTEFLGNQIKKEGSEFNEWYGYKSAGLFQTKDDVTASALLKPATSPGDIKYVDISGPNGVPDGIISPDYDRVLLGGSLPRYMFGSNFRINYKNFDFSMVIQGIGKQNAVKSSYMVQPFTSVPLKLGRY
jgi:TonB-linked SusC/RagA family outer membrane protein